MGRAALIVVVAFGLSFTVAGKCFGDPIAALLPPTGTSMQLDVGGPLMSSEYRIWRTTDGRASVESRFLRTKADEAYFQKRDGSIAKSPLDLLCPADRIVLVNAVSSVPDELQTRDGVDAAGLGVASVPITTHFQEEQVGTFPQAVGAMERILAKDPATIGADEVSTMDNVLQFVSRNLPDSARATASSSDESDEEGDGRWEWQKSWFRGCLGRRRCSWECVWVPTGKKGKKASEELSVLRRKVNALRGVVTNLLNNPDINRADFAKQVYGVTLSADGSPPGLIIRE